MDSVSSTYIRTCMKRVGYLIEEIANPENLRLAFLKARRGKQSKQEVLDYTENLDENLLHLREQLLKGKVLAGGYYYFKIYDPKERLICAAPFAQRVLHHALMNICHVYFDRFQIYHSYASRKGKGTFAAINTASQNQRKYKWFLKLDIHKFFDSVDHCILEHLIHRMFKDSLLLSAFQQIIRSYEIEADKGLPIGNLTSQYFANHYLGVLDHYIMNELRVSAYVRYMDDMVIWAMDKTQLLDVREKVFAFIREQLKMTCNPPCLNKCDYALSFFGFQLKKSLIRLNKRSKRRYITKLKLYYTRFEKEVWSQEEFQAHVLPLIAFTEKADALRFRRQVMTQII